MLLAVTKCGGAPRPGEELRSRTIRVISGKELSAPSSAKPEFSVEDFLKA